MSIGNIFLEQSWDTAMRNILIFNWYFWKASVLYKLQTSSFHAQPWTLKCKFIFVRLCWRNIVFIMSDKQAKATRLMKLFRDACESKKQYEKELV